MTTLADVVKNWDIEKAAHYLFPHLRDLSMNKAFFHLQDEHGYRGKTLIDRGEIDRVHEEMGHASVDHVHSPLKAIEKADRRLVTPFNNMFRDQMKSHLRESHGINPGAFESEKNMIAIHKGLPPAADHTHTIRRIAKAEPFEVEWEWSEISKFDDEQQIIFGWAYVSHDKDGAQVIDKSGEYVPNPKDLEKAAYNFVRNCRIGRDFHGLLEKDDDDQASTLVESIYFDPEKQAAMGIPPGILPTSAWWVGLKVLRKTLWHAFKKGERPMLSVHGFGTSKAVLVD